MTSGHVICVLMGILTLIAAGILWDSWRSGRAFRTPLPQPYRRRLPQEAEWRQRYTDEAMAKADALLSRLCDFFTFNPDDRFRFVPGDRIQDIYRRCYPRWKFWQLGDSMEIESLGMWLEREFGIDLAHEYPEITLGDVVDQIVKHEGTNAKTPPA